MSLFVQEGKLFEPAHVVEVACSGIGRVEFMGGGMGCFVLYRNTIAPGTGDSERRVCGRIFAPLDLMPEAVDLMTKALVEAGLVRSAVRARCTFM